MARIIRAVAALTAMGVVATAWAEQPPEDRDASEVRFLGEHRFVPLQLVQYPFINSRVFSITSVGAAQFEVTLLQELAEEIEVVERITEDGRGLLIQQSFRFALAPTRWLAFELAYSGTGIVGSDTIGTLAIGSALAYGGDLGVAVRLLESERVYVSGRVVGGVRTLDGLVPSRLVDSIVIIDGGFDFSAPRLRVDGERYGVGGSIAAALALSRRWGLQASTGLSWSTTEIGEDDDDTYVWEAAAGVTLRLGGIELAGGAGFSRRFGADVASTVSSVVQPLEETALDLELGLYYVEQRRLELGISVVGQLTGDDDRAIAEAGLGYYF